MAIRVSKGLGYLKGARKVRAGVGIPLHAAPAAARGFDVGARAGAGTLSAQGARRAGARVGHMGLPAPPKMGATRRAAPEMRMALPRGNPLPPPPGPIPMPRVPGKAVVPWVEARKGSRTAAWVSKHRTGLAVGGVALGGLTIAHNVTKSGNGTDRTGYAQGRGMFTYGG